MKNVIGYIIILFVGVVVGLSISENKVETVIKKEYLPSTTILTDSISPYKISTWDVNDIDIRIPKYVFYNDTVYKDSIITKTDSLNVDDLKRIANDYVLLKKYNLDYSTDTTGKFVVDLAISNNKLLYSKATITPIQSYIQNNIEVKPKLFTPFIMAGTSIDLSTQNLILGLSIRQKIMVGASLIRFNEYSGYTINIGVNL